MNAYEHTNRFAADDRTAAQDARTALVEAKRRLHEVAHPEETGDGGPNRLLDSLHHPWGWAIGAVAVGAGLTAVARTSAGRSLVRVAGRSALTAARVLVVPAILKAMTSSDGNDGGARRLPRH